MPKRDRLQPLQVYRLLPRTNCKQCGLMNCYAFAFALASREKSVADCPPLLAEEFVSAYETLGAAFGSGEVQETGLLIEREKCNGCGDCVVVCNRALSTLVNKGIVSHRDLTDAPPALDILEGVVEVVSWTSCKRTINPPNMCRLCEEKCPFGALELVALPGGEDADSCGD